MADNTSVRVALRIRPMLPKEDAQKARECITQPDDMTPQVSLGAGNRSFTYDYVFGVKSTQQDVFACVEPLVDSFFEGYNATVLAYGQTGAGKTHTMGTNGTGLNSQLTKAELGVIPRVIQRVFDRIRENEATVDAKVTVSFLEIHNESIVDLFGDGKGTSLAIRESLNNVITVAGMTEIDVSSGELLLAELERGSALRHTASTNMNEASSRSHAIFSITLEQGARVTGDGETSDKDLQRTKSKFHFVDLAGSERLKRTKAEGDRLKEGISINGGLLALGNVISALGDKKRKAKHVPYRDSKLTRLLQDSLGGNSRTLMIACVSGADVNFEETLNTLRYADRAKNIQNKPIKNLDLNSRQLALLHEKVAELQNELAKERAGKRMSLGNSVMGKEMKDTNERLKMENAQLKTAYENALAKISALTRTNDEILAQRDAYQFELQRLQLSSKPGYDAAPSAFAPSAFAKENSENDPNTANVEGAAAPQGTEPLAIVTGYLNQISALKAELEVARTLQDKTDDVFASSSRLRRSHRAESADTLASEDGEEDGATQDSEDEKSSDDDELDGETDRAIHDLEEASKQKELEWNAQQTQLRKDINAIDSDINEKEGMLKKLVESHEVQQLKAGFEKKLQDLQENIRSVTEERDKMVEALELLKKDKTAGAVQVRKDYEKKLKGLNQQIAELKKRETEHARREKDRQLQIKEMEALRKSIEELRSKKVALVRTNKDEQRKHTEWAQENEKVIRRYIAQARKDKARIKKLELEAHKKDIVMKEKVREHHMAAKRGRQNVLKADKDKPSSIPKATKKFSPPKASWAGKPPSPKMRKLGTAKPGRIKDLKAWMAREVEKHVQRVEASNTLEEELAVRDQLNAELNKLNDMKADITAVIDASPRKRAAYEKQSGEGVSLNEQLQAITEQIDSCEERISYQSSRIEDAQLSLIVKTEESIPEEVAEKLRTLSPSECRALLSYCFATAVQAKRAEKHTEDDLLAGINKVEDERDEAVRNLGETRALAQKLRSEADARQGAVAKLQTELGKAHDQLAALIRDEDGRTQVELEVMRGEPTLTDREVRISALVQLKNQHISILEQQLLTAKAAQQETVATTQEILGLGECRRELDRANKLGAAERLDRLAALASGSSTENVKCVESHPPATLRYGSYSSVDDTYDTSYGAALAVEEMDEDSYVDGKRRSTEATNVFERLAAENPPLKKQAPGEVTRGRPQTAGWNQKPKKNAGDETSIATHMYTLDEHAGHVLDLVESNSALYSASKDGTIIEWDIETGVCLDYLKGSRGSVGSLALLPDASNNILSAGQDCAVLKWDLSSKKAGSVFRTPSEVVGIAAHGTTIYAALVNGGVMMFDHRQDRKPLGTIKCDRVLSMTVCAGDMLALGCKNHTVQLVDLLAPMADLMDLPPPHYEGIAALSCRYGTLFSGSGDFIRKWSNIQDHRTAPKLREDSATRTSQVFALAESEEQHLFSAGRESTVKIWDVATASPTLLGMKETGHSGPIRAVEALPNRCFATGSQDKTIKIWQLEDPSRA